MAAATTRALGWLGRVTLVLLFSGGLMIMAAPPASADNCDIRINPEDCQNTAWVVGSVAAVAACGAVVAACLYGGQSTGEQVPTEQTATASSTGPATGTATVPPPPATAPAPPPAPPPPPPVPPGSSARDERGAEPELEIKLALQHTIVCVAGGWWLYRDAGEEMARAHPGSPGPWLPSTIDFMEAARRAGFVMPERVARFDDLFEVLWPLPDQSVRRLVLVGYGRRDEFYFAGSWDAARTGLVPTNALDPRLITGDSRVRDLSRVFTPDAVVDIYACGAAIGPVVPHMLADALRVPVRTFAEPVAFHLRWAGNTPADRGRMSCPGHAGDSLTTLVPPMVHRPSG